MAWNISDTELEPESPITQSLMTRLRNGGIETGRQMMIRQNAAPLGWTKITENIDDRAIRLFSGAPSDGGSIGFSTVFARQFTDNLTLTQSHLPNYTLPKTLNLSGSQSGGLVRNLSFSMADSGGSGTNHVRQAIFSETTLSLTGNTTLGGGGQPHRHKCEMRVQYIGMCLFQKL